jgi:hypothetical protein
MPSRRSGAIGSFRRTLPVARQIGHYGGVAEPPYWYGSEGVHQGVTNRPGDDRPLRVPKVDLSFIRVDHQVRLQFEETEVMIESPFVVAVNGTQLELDPGERGDLGPILALYPDSLQEATRETA